MDELLTIIARGVRYLTASALIACAGYMIYDSPRFAGGLAVVAVSAWAWWQVPGARAQRGPRQ